MVPGALAEVFQRSGPDGRRIGRRVPLEGLWLTWRPQGEAKRGWRRRKDQEVRVIDLSVSGAQVEVVEGELLAPGALVDIELDGARGTCRVRRFQTHPDGMVTYGVEFKGLEPRLEARIGQLLASEQQPPPR